jgi:hypothetical protein
MIGQQDGDAVQPAIAGSIEIDSYRKCAPRRAANLKHRAVLAFKTRTCVFDGINATYPYRFNSLRVSLQGDQRGICSEA